MSLSDQQLLDALSRMPFVESTELALILGEPHATVHRALTGLLEDGIVGKVTHGTVHLPSSGRYCPTARGMREVIGVWGYDNILRDVASYITDHTTAVNGAASPGTPPTPLAYETS